MGSCGEGRGLGEGTGWGGLKRGSAKGSRGLESLRDRHFHSKKLYSKKNDLAPCTVNFSFKDHALSLGLSRPLYNSFDYISAVFNF